MASSTRIQKPALRVHQWRASWEDIDFNETEGRRKPDPYFYVMSMPAIDLRRLSGIYRRSVEGGLPRSADTGVQRKHDSSRSTEIAEYVRHGYPWSTLNEQKRVSGEYSDLVKPGWLPTGIVINVLRPEDVRDGRVVHTNDTARFSTSNGTHNLEYPESFDDHWSAKANYPIEVIDGQHRLWAFSQSDTDLEGYEVPVVAFDGLDIGWQAYLFYTVNIKPKRINTSLAYDLYPLLRTAEWLDRSEEHHVYRETRAQELVEAMWSHPESPWKDRIDMLGDQGRRFVTQAAWIRSLIASVIKQFDGPGTRIGGLFGSTSESKGSVLGWKRSQQAAFLIQLWSSLQSEIAETSDEWATSLRKTNTLLEMPEDLDAAFAGKNTLLNTDQGLRGVLRVANDLCIVSAEALALERWVAEPYDGRTFNASIDEALQSLASQPLALFLNEIAARLSKWDWRSSKAPGLTEEQRRLKSRFRGGTGYKEIRLDLLAFLGESDVADVSDAANSVLAAEA